MSPTETPNALSIGMPTRIAAARLRSVPAAFIRFRMSATLCIPVVAAMSFVSRPAPATSLSNVRDLLTLAIMAQNSPDAIDLPVTPGVIADNIIGFARALRAAGLPVGPGATIDALKALQVVGLGSRADVF